MRKIVVIAHNIRSTHNVGSLLRTAEGLGVQKVYLTGYTPYPKSTHDVRLPHIAAKIEKQIDKTALGAQHTLVWDYCRDIVKLITKLKKSGYQLTALEQAPHAIKLQRYKPPQKIALLLGREVEGIEPELLKQSDVVLEIPMQGHKESFNVVQAAAMALYHLTYYPFT